MGQHVVDNKIYYADEYRSIVTKFLILTTAQAPCWECDIMVGCPLISSKGGIVTY